MTLDMKLGWFQREKATGARVLRLKAKTEIAARRGVKTSMKMTTTRRRSESGTYRLAARRGFKRPQCKWVNGDTRRKGVTKAQQKGKNRSCSPEGI